MSELRNRMEAAKAVADGVQVLAEAGVSVADVTDSATMRRLVTGEPTPDVAESGIEADLTVPVHVAWSRVMGEVQFIAKNRQTTSGAKFSYRGIDDVMNAVAGALRKHGVMVIPSGVEPTFEIIKTSNNANMNYCRAVCHFTIHGPKGDTMPGSCLGEGFDSGDKSGTKAQSVAYRTFLIEALAIPVKRPEYDTEHGQQHEIAGPTRPTVGEYAAEILSASTSLARLSQIMAEVDGDRSLGMAEVELAGEEQKISLSRLVRRVGKERKNAEGGNV